MCQEQLDLIVFTIQQPNARKARAYTFQNRLVGSKRTQEVTRVADNEIIDGVTQANIDLLGGDKEITDFNLSFKRDVILCKLYLDVFQSDLVSFLFPRNARKGPNSVQL